MVDGKNNEPGLLKRVSIVIQEIDDKGNFTIKMEGDLDRLRLGLPEEKRSAAEFWGARLFNICRQVLNETGAITDVTRKT